MKAFLSSPQTRQNLLLVAAYSLFLVFSVGAFLLTTRIHTNIQELGVLFNASSWLMRLIYTWGSFPLFIPFIFLAVFIQSYLEKGARNGQLWPRAKKIFLIEAGVGIFTLLVSQVVIRLI
jgi:hypothetical protein